MPFPSTFSAFNRPASTDRLNSPSHSALHNTVSSAVGQIEQLIGLSTSSALGSLMYDIRSSDSGGGGHVQKAQFGGTGQTTFIKGDILVAQSASLLSKLAIGNDTDILTADSTAAIGVKWATKITGKIASSGYTLALTNSSSETSVMSVTIPGSTLGTSNAIRATLFIGNLNVSSAGDTLTLRANYGTTSVATHLISSVIGNTTASVNGIVTFNLLAANAINAQRANVLVDLNTQTPYLGVQSFIGMRKLYTNASAEDSNGNKTLGITAKWNDAQVDNDLNLNGYTVERIQ